MRSCFQRLSYGDVIVIPCDKLGYWFYGDGDYTHLMKVKVMFDPDELSEKHLCVDTGTKEAKQYYFRRVKDLAKGETRIITIIRLRGRDPNSIPVKEIVPR